MLGAEFSRDTTAAWLGKLADRVPVAPVNGIAKALENPFVRERGALTEFHYADGRNARLVANPIRCADVALP